MKRSGHHGFRKPLAPLYDFGRILCEVWFRLVYGYSADIDPAVPKDGPLVVLSAHPGRLDFLLTAFAAKRRRMNFVVTEYFYRRKHLSPFLRLLGAIPKIQFYPDPRCIAAIIRVLKRGGAVCLYPAGQTSICGVPTGVDDTIVKLLRKANAPVAAAVPHGGFFMLSRVAPFSINRGKCHTTLRMILQPDQMAAMTDAQIYETVCQALDFDEYAWQRETGARYRSKNRAAGYHKILYLCPKCGAKYTQQVGKHLVCCSACGNRAVVGPDMHMRPDGEGSVAPATLKEWYQWQEGLLKARIDDMSQPFVLQTPVAVSLVEGAAYRPAGEGIATLDREALRFEGAVDGQPAAFAVAHESLPGLFSVIGLFFEVYVPPYGAIRCYPDDGNVTCEWKMAQEYIFSKIKWQNGNKKECEA